MPSVGWTRRRGTNARIAASGSGTSATSDRQVRAVGVDGHRPGLRPGEPVADLEQPARPDPEERVPPETLAALDGLEEVGGGRPVVEPEERADRRLQVGRAGGAQEQRVGVAGEALRLGQAERIGCRHRGGLRAACPARIRKRPVVPGRKVVPSAVPPSFGDAALRDRRVAAGRSSVPPIGAALYRWRSAPEPTGIAPRRRCAHRSVRRLPGPFAAVVAPVSTSHRISLPTLDGYSSRSQPALRDVRRRIGAGRGARQGRSSAGSSSRPASGRPGSKPRQARTGSRG